MTSRPPLETDAPPVGASPDDIARAREAVAETQPPPASEPPPLGAERPAAEVRDRRTEPLDDDDEQKIRELEQLAGDRAALEEKLHGMTIEDLADVIELGFGWYADDNGAHWEISPKRAQRLARWLKKVIERHAESLEWVLRNLPELMCALLFGYEIWIRIRTTRQLKAKPAGQVAPPPAERPADGSPA